MSDAPDFLTEEPAETTPPAAAPPAPAEPPKAVSTPAGDPPAAAAPPDPAPAIPPGHLPLAEVLSIQERAQKAEAEAKAARDALADFERRQAAQVKPPALPDVLEDPQGFADYVANASRMAVVNFSLDGAKARHGAAFDEAFAAVEKAGDPALARAIYQSPDPGAALMAWHKRTKLISDIGDDPDAWVRRRYQELTAGAAPPPPGAAAPRPGAPPAPTLPTPSLGAAPGVAPGTDPADSMSPVEFVFGRG